MIDIFKRLIRWAKVTAYGADDNQFPTQQVEYMGKTADCLIVFPYGIHGNVTPEALALMFAVQGDESNRAAIAYTPKNRPQMANGENCIYHPPTGSIIHFRANGDIEVTSGGTVNVKANFVNVDAPNATFTGNVQIDGNLHVNGNIASDQNVSAQVNVSATAHLQGATLSVTDGSGTAVISGNIAVTGATSLSTNVTSNGKNIGDSHTHSGVQTGAGNTGPVN